MSARGWGGGSREKGHMRTWGGGLSKGDTLCILPYRHGRPEGGGRLNADTCGKGGVGSKISKISRTSFKSMDGP